MTSAERSSPLDTAEANNSSDGGLEATGIVTDTEQQDGNNNEANDSNNNVGTTVTSETPTTASISASSATPGSSAEASLSVIRPPALPPRPPNLMLPHAGAVATRGLQMPYTIMQPSGKSIFFTQKYAGLDLIYGKIIDHVGRSHSLMVFLFGSTPHECTVGYFY